MKSLVYRHEQPLFQILLFLSGLFWLGLVLGTAGLVLIYLPFVAIGYLFAQSGFISYIRGSSVRLSEE